MLRPTSALDEDIMRGTMMDFPPHAPHAPERADKLFSRVEIVSRRPDRSLVRTCYGNFYRRARQLASALTKLGLRSGDRVCFNDVESFRTPGGFLRCSVCRRHLAHSEFEAPLTRKLPPSLITLPIASRCPE